MEAHVVEALGRDETRAAVQVFIRAIGMPPPDESRLAVLEAGWEPGRSMGIRGDGGALAATAWSFGCRTAVPGGTVQASGVSRVGVRADHTRRGMLTALMRAQLTDLAARGDVLASLRATEGVLYGRFGYGVATRYRTIRLRRRGGRGIRTEIPTSGTVRVVDPESAVETLRPLHDALALVRPGGITRFAQWWDGSLQSRVRGGDHLLVLVHRGADGDDGFAVASVGEGPEFGARPLTVSDLHARDVAATADLWRFLLSVDLVGEVRASGRPMDDPLDLLLTDPRDAAVTSVDDETWLRIVDVPAALAARSWAPAEPVTIAVLDPLLPANEGTYRIADGHAERTGSLSADADLTCSVTALAMAYLGDRRPSELVATGWWQGATAAAARADQAFAVPAAPWCGTHF
ncbi:GNAT family N-acetyltransferase [Pseudonocardia sp. CA-107938]|uniref:GNAT family N-acetyltransferase n=1 Tax=Pseudonocardia sp. CA-107938 TaxID=3240021 RepID=UPI003D8FA11C